MLKDQSASLYSDISVPTLDFMSVFNIRKIVRRYNLTLVVKVERPNKVKCI